MTPGGSKRLDSTYRMENLEKLLAKKANVITNIDRIRQSAVDRNISFNPMELECDWIFLNHILTKQSTSELENGIR